jgi:iron uptake system component EfeO
MTLVSASRRVALIAAVVLSTAGACVPNAAESNGSIAVTSTDDACTVVPSTAPSGPVVFDVTNSGTQVTEFYLLAEDGLRVVGEVEHIAPGTSRTLTATVQPGSYLTLCKPGESGPGVGRSAFTVTGEVTTRSPAQ